MLYTYNFIIGKNDMYNAVGCFIYEQPCNNTISFFYHEMVLSLNVFLPLPWLSGKWHFYSMRKKWPWNVSFPDLLVSHTQERQREGKGAPDKHQVTNARKQTNTKKCVLPKKVTVLFSSSNMKCDSGGKENPGGVCSGVCANWVSACVYPLPCYSLPIAHTLWILGLFYFSSLLFLSPWLVF